MVVLSISIFIINGHPHTAWRVPLALAPVIPVAFALWAFVRFLGRMDELQRRIQLEALGIAFGGSGLLTFSYGFLEGVGFPHISWIIIFCPPAIIAAIRHVHVIDMGGIFSNHVVCSYR